MPPKISIVTPSYNQGVYLEETIRSILDQGYPNLEYIVIDGGSTDHTVEILKRFSSRLTYWVSEPDKGQTDALNKGFGRATGDVCAYLNSDDVLLPGTLKRVKEAFEDPDCLWICSPILVGENVTTSTVWKPEAVSFVRFVAGMAFGQQGVFWRRTLMEDPPFKPELHYVMDFDFFSRIFGRYGPPRTLSEPSAFFRLHPAAKTATVPHVLKKEFNEMAGRRASEVSAADAVQIYREMARVYSRIHLMELLQEKSGHLRKRLLNAWAGFRILIMVPHPFRDRMFVGGIRRLVSRIFYP